MRTPVIPLLCLCAAGCVPVERPCPPPSPAPERVVRSHASLPADAPSLSALVRRADRIVVARIVDAAPSGPLLEGTTPDDDDWMGNQTTYRLEVERTLKGDPAASSSARVQIPGGLADGVRDLPDHGAPLTVGGRYLLFLDDLSDHPLTRRHGFVPVVVGGRVYRQSDAGVLRLVHPDRGQVLLEAGRGAPGRGIGAWRFEEPGAAQIVGVPEAGAIDAVRVEVARTRGWRLPEETTRS